jgi:hypothetical protein
MIASVTLILSLFLGQASAAVPSFPLTKQNCQQQINQIEKEKGIPCGLLEAIAHIESKLNPLIVNAGGKAHFFHSIESAANFIREKQKQGYRNISVGPMQLHVPSHRHRFKSLEDMLDPKQNINYAASLFKRLERQYGSAEAAVRHYHSDNPAANGRYKDRVFGAWAKIKHRHPLTPVSTKGFDHPIKPRAKPKIQFGYGARKKIR